MLRQITRAFALLLLVAPCIAQYPSQPNIPPKKSKPPTGTIAGTIFCADTNLPARGAEVFLLQISKGDQGIRSGGTTDLEGRFVIHHVAEGSVFVVAQLPGYLNPIADLTRSGMQSMTDEERKAIESRLTSVNVSAGQTAEVSLRLERAGEIDGTVLYDDGSPAVGLRVILKSAKEGADTFGSTVLQAVSMTNDLLRRTDDRGRFRILGVAPGRYLVAVSVPAFSSADPSSSNFFVRALQGSEFGGMPVYVGNTTRASAAKVIKIESAASSQDVDITIPLSKLHTVRGHVVLKRTNQPPPAATIELFYADTHEPARVTMAPNGDFELHYVPEDRYVLQAFASPDPLPNFEMDEGEVVGPVVSGSAEHHLSFSTHAPAREPLSPSEEPIEVPVAVTGDVDNIVIAVSDPPKSQSQPDPNSTDAPAVISPQ